MVVAKKPYYKTKTFKVIVQLSMTAVICIAEALTGYISNCTVFEKVNLFYLLARPFLSG